jgi:hypothetical protein
MVENLKSLVQAKNEELEAVQKMFLECSTTLSNGTFVAWSNTPHG